MNIPKLANLLNFYNGDKSISTSYGYRTYYATNKYTATPGSRSLYAWLPGKHYMIVATDADFATVVDSVGRDAILFAQDSNSTVLYHKSELELKKYLRINRNDTRSIVRETKPKRPRKPQRPLTQDDKALIRQLYASGHNANQIASHLKTNYTTVYRFVRDNLKTVDNAQT